jgi:hypothetical protein
MHLNALGVACNQAAPSHIVRYEIGPGGPIGP